MARSRANKADNWMPKRVYRGNSCYEWRPAGGGYTKLCPLSSSPGEVWQAYEAAIAQGTHKRSLSDLAEKYFRSRYFIELKPKTPKGYRDSWKAIEPVLGHMKSSDLRPSDIRSYMDIRGEHAAVAANREHAILSIICRYGTENEWMNSNPCLRVRRFKERGRQDIYISDENYISFLNDSDLTVQIFMELAYLLAARTQDIRKIKIADINSEGINIIQEKTGKRQLKLWNPRLRRVIDVALHRRESISKKLCNVSDYLLITRDGLAYSVQGWNSLWKRNRERVIQKRKARGENGASLKIDWTFHDIKAKSISDYLGDKQMFSGHRSSAMMQRYNRSPDIVTSHTAEDEEIVFNLS